MLRSRRLETGKITVFMRVIMKDSERKSTCLMLVRIGKYNEA